MKDDLDSCPTGEHSLSHRQCGYVVYIDLRPWAKASSYRFRFEESYKAKTDTHVRGDGRAITQFHTCGTTSVSIEKAGFRGILVARRQLEVMSMVFL
jgi:hypothetical protein